MTLVASPVDHPLFWPLAQTLGGLLAIALVLLLLVERRHLHHLHTRVLFQRWAVWAVIAPLFSLAVLGGSGLMLILVSAMVWQALREYCSLVGLPRLYQSVLLGMGLVVGPLAVWAPDLFFSILPLLLIVATLQPILTQDIGQGFRRLALAAIGFAYLPLLLGHLLLIHAHLPGGPGLLLAIALGVALSDIGAFTVGKLFGRRRLSPLISPNKTWEGALGSVIGAYAGVSLVGFALPSTLTGPSAVLLPLGVALGAIWGDLLESLIKREFGMKDAGVWLPGFGGLLDRIDSLIIVGPLAYHLLKLTA